MQLPKNLDPMVPSTAEALAIERTKATFNVREMEEFLLDNETRASISKLESIFRAEPEIFDTHDVYFLTRPEKMERALKVGSRLLELMKERKITHDEIPIADILLDMLGPFSLHRGMFVPTLQNQATPEQQDAFLKPALNYEIIGCYAQTEIGHGSNIKGLETTCTYIPETDEFEINTPTISSSKWWVGSLGVSATHAMVMAQLIVNGKNYGPNPVVVPVRSTVDHRPLDGVTVGDIGPKFGFNTMDNGFLLLDHVRVPRFNLMQRYISVSREGKVTRPENVDPKATYGTMVYVRTSIVRNMSQVLSKSLTIAIRYASVRRQFAGKTDKLAAADDGSVESPVLDYSMVQYRLIPLLAQNYAMFATSQAFAKHYEECMDELNKGNFAPLKELHAIACGLKRWTTEVAVRGTDTCRHVCGGHGFSQFSGLGEFYGNIYPNIIWEGDNYLLTQQTSQYLLTQVGLLRKGAPVADNQTTRYLRRHLTDGAIDISATPAFATRSVESVASDPEMQLELLGYRAASMASQLADQIAVQGRSWNQSLVAVQRLCDAHSDYIVAQYFRQHLDTLPNGSSLSPVLEKIASVLFLYVLEQSPGDLFRLPGGAAFTGSKMTEVERLLGEYIAEVREVAVPLVDSFGVSDLRLNSALGRSDGRVYESYLQWAMEEPLNREGTGDAVRSEWFEKYYRPLLQPKNKQAKL